MEVVWASCLRLSSRSCPERRQNNSTCRARNNCLYSVAHFLSLTLPFSFSPFSLFLSCFTSLSLPVPLYLSLSCFTLNPSLSLTLSSCYIAPNQYATGLIKARCWAMWEQRGHRSRGPAGPLQPDTALPPSHLTQ